MLKNPVNARIQLQKLKNVPHGCLARNKNHIDIPQPVPYSYSIWYA